jgi:hypothetical protein
MDLYRFELIPNYTTDHAYQDFFRKVFRIEGEEYTEKIITKCLDFIHDNTCNIPEFKELYLLSAATMMSEDTQIGLAVLFSYHYLFHFHTLLCTHFTGGDITELLAVVKELISK